MFFYTSLFIASLIVAIVIIHVWRAIANAGKAVYQAILPSAKENNNLTSHLDTQRLTTTINPVPTPWGWKGGANPSQVARSTTPAPANPATWGWSGDNANKQKRMQGHIGHKTVTVNGNATRNSAEEKPIVGWPYRAEKTGFSEKINQANRIEVMRKNHLKTNKPWGW